MRIGLLHIGDELLAGKILNTNGRDAALWLGELGRELAFALTLGDDRAAIAAALRDCLEHAPGGGLPRCEVLILTGGLGPTHDDLTREALADFLGVPLEFSPEAAAWMTERYELPPDQIPDGQRTQLLVPRGVAALRNPAGSACGLGFERNGARVFAFPGVPSEFKSMFDAHCRPLLERREGSGGARLLRRRAITFGLSESAQRERLQGFAFPEPFRFSSLPNEAGVTLALEGFVPEAEAEPKARALDQAWADLLARLPPECIVDRDGASLTETVFRLLRDRGATVATAESCTAGALGFLITEVPGSSQVFRQGWLTYSNAAKTALLGVPEALLREHGAVSEAVAMAMAEGCRRAAKSDYAVSVTGIAGPDGGSPEKPVGLVYVAAASTRGVQVARFHFRTQNRNSVRRLSAHAALNQLRLLILKDLKKS